MKSTANLKRSRQAEHKEHTLHLNQEVDFNWYFRSDEQRFSNELQPLPPILSYDGMYYADKSKAAYAKTQFLHGSLKKSSTSFNCTAGAPGANWPSNMTAHSRLMIQGDPQNLSHLTREDKMRINELQLQIEELKNHQMVKKVPTAFELFENKHFNSLKTRFEHLSNEDIKELLVSKWENEITDEKREEFESLAKAIALKANQELQANKSQINDLLGRIHDIKYASNAGVSSSQIKASGKIKFMSAYRFFRKEMVPVIKQQEPLLDSKGRHAVVQQLWHQLHDRHKLAYVLMSRADREKSLYIIRLN